MNRLFECIYALGWAMTASLAVADQPNVVFIFADDLGYGDLGCYGATKVQTPNIDRLAKEGRTFTDAHSASAVCTPSRYALITGEYPHRKNLYKPVFLKTGLVIDTEQQTIADVMKNAGYATACIGKWHLGFGERAPNWNSKPTPGPLELGFDYYFGVPVVNSHPPFVYVENHNVLGLVSDDPFVFGKTAKTREFPEKMGIDQLGGPAAITFTGRKNSDIEDGRIKPDAPPAQLYDLESDLPQTTNVYAKHPAAVEELSGLLRSYQPNNPRPKSEPARSPLRQSNE